MIDKFIKKFDEKRDWIKSKLLDSSCLPNYEMLLRLLCEAISGDDEEYEFPNPDCIKLVDFGDYQGTLVFVIGGHGYQPHNHWATWVWYGSCGGCDTLQAINDYIDSDYTDDEIRYHPTNEHADQWMTLMLHMLQHMVEIVS
jgi:hypothetical protein